MKQWTIAGSSALLLVAGLLLVFDWPWWAGLYLLLFSAGVMLASFFLRKIWARRREESRAGEARTGELAQAKARAEKEKDGEHGIRERWDKALATLRHSPLGKGGDPLYALPWYLVVGAKGSGKSTFLSSARLSSAVGDHDRSPAGETEQCEWWFFDSAVVIDTPGAYADGDEGERAQWQFFLSLLARHRRKEPLSGLIVAVAADRLLNSPMTELESEGCAVRRLIDELMLALGVQVPVYLLVTKCDLIPGAGGFCEQLPAFLDQPMGVLREDPGEDAGPFLQRALDTVYERLRALRLDLLKQPRSDDAALDLLIFPERFAAVASGLASFARHAFGANPYLETPLLRGMFFGSGRQEGSLASPAGTGAPPLSRDQGRTGSGIFLHDLLAKVLPSDRPSLEPTGAYARWRTVTGNAGLAAWVVAGIALCGLLSFSFAWNLGALRAIPGSVGEKAQLRGDLPADLATLERLRQEIVKVERLNGDWWMPRFGLDQSVQVERRLKQSFCRQFREEVLAPFDKETDRGMANITPASPDNLYAQYVVHLLRRIEILKARLDAGEPGQLRAKPQPGYFSLVAAPAAVDTPETRKAFGELYFWALLWSDDPGGIAREIAALRLRLKKLIEAGEGDLQWLAVWVDRHSGIAPVTLKDFWGGSLTANGERSVPPSFTRKGKETMDALVAELGAAAPDSARLITGKAGFEAWCRAAALDAWRAFAAEFPKGVERLQGPAEWQQAALRMATERNPFFALTERISQELAPLAASGPLPLWLAQLFQFQEARARGLAEESAALGKAAEGSKKFLSSVRKTVGQEGGAQKLEAQIQARRACRDYLSALNAIAPAITSRTQLFQLASQTFAEDPAVGKSPFHLASASAARLRVGFSAPPDPLFFMLLNGPVEFLWGYLRKESGAQLQALWEEQVLAATMGMSGEQAVAALLGPDGLAWRFVKGPAAPFLTRDLSGYHPKETIGGTIAFRGELFSFMNWGVKAQAALMSQTRGEQHHVGIKGLPTDANGEARVKPHATRLELNCGGYPQVLVNNNYPVGKTFSWSPDSCSGVQLQIEVGEQVLTRQYPGRQGFADFLEDFPGGRHTYAAREFPGERSALARMGVRSITVNYQFVGTRRILKQKSTLSVQPPRTIAQGWD